MKRFVLIVAVLCIVEFLSSSVFAEIQVTDGTPVMVYADPSDVVVELDNAGPCKSKYFHIRRARQNFKELTAVVLSAFATGKRLKLFVELPCVKGSDRNFLSHGGEGN